MGKIRVRKVCSLKVAAGKITMGKVGPIEQGACQIQPRKACSGKILS